MNAKEEYIQMIQKHEPMIHKVLLFSPLTKREKSIAELRVFQKETE